MKQNMSKLSHCCKYDNTATLRDPLNRDINLLDIFLNILLQIHNYRQAPAITAPVISLRSGSQGVFKKTPGWEYGKERWVVKDWGSGFGQVDEGGI